MLICLSDPVSGNFWYMVSSRSVTTWTRLWYHN